MKRWEKQILETNYFPEYEYLKSVSRIIEESHEKTRIETIDELLKLFPDGRIIDERIMKSLSSDDMIYQCRWGKIKEMVK